MKISYALVAAIVLCLGTSPALAADVDKFVCARVSGGPEATFSMTIDYATREIDVPHSGFQPPDPDSVEVTDGWVKWSFMRGFVDFNRKTGQLDWNTTAEYDYLETIGQPADNPESDYQGRMQCEKDGGALKAN